MRYYKQLHRWTAVYVFVLALAAICLFLAYSEQVIDERITFLACGAVGLICGWVLKKTGSHYLEIDDEKIIHRGFRHWTIRKSDVTRVERGRKGWFNEHELYFKIHAADGEYNIDDGFLTDEEHVQELEKAIGPRRA